MVILRFDLYQQTRDCRPVLSCVICNTLQEVTAAETCCYSLTFGVLVAELFVELALLCRQVPRNLHLDPQIQIPALGALKAGQTLTP